MKLLFRLLTYALAFSTLHSCLIYKIDYDLYAVVYGISDYNDVSDLNYSHLDAQSMGSLLQEKNYNVILRTNLDATYTNLTADLAQIEGQATSNDLFLFFFSGHGTQVAQGGGEPPEGDSDDEGIVLNEGATNRILTDDELAGLIEGIPCFKRVVIIDACNSGGLIGDGLEVDGTPPVYRDGPPGFGDILSTAISLYTNYSDNTSDIPPSTALVISASGEREFSYDVGDPYFHGLFTYYLLEAAQRGDQNGDGFITVIEAFYYTKDAIENNWNVNVSDSSYQFSPHVSGGPLDFILFKS